MALTCLICGKTYVSLEALKYHLETYPSSIKDRYKCSFEDCFKVFTDNRAFYRHLDVHFGKGKELLVQ